MKLATQWAKLMLPSGYDTVTIDEFWYPNDGESASSLDTHGRAVVDESKWPSAKGGNGFKTVAKNIHALGLKLGIHVMHGVPKAALNGSYTVLGMPSAKVSDLSDGTWCPWNAGWGRVNMAKPGAQEYFDSIYAQYADWGIDFIKYVLGHVCGLFTVALRVACQIFARGLAVGIDLYFCAQERLCLWTEHECDRHIHKHRGSPQSHGQDRPYLRLFAFTSMCSRYSIHGAFKWIYVQTYPASSKTAKPALTFHVVRCRRQGFPADINGPGTDKPGQGVNGPKNALKITSPLVNMCVEKSNIRYQYCLLSADNSVHCTGIA